MYHRAEDMQREQGLRLEVSQLKAENAKLRVERDEWKRVAESKAAVRPDVGAGDRGRRMIDLEVEAIRRKIARLEGLKAERLCDDNDQLKAENAKLREHLRELEKLYAKAKIDNATLRTQLADVTESMGRVEERCARLRELVTDMWQFAGAACKKYPRLFDPVAQGGQMVRPNMIDSFEQRMSELGIEAEQEILPGPA